MKTDFITSPWLVMSNHGYDGWNIRPCETKEIAINVRDQEMSFGNSEVIIAKYCLVTSQIQEV